MAIATLWPSVRRPWCLPRNALGGVRVEPLDDSLARLAGEAIAAVAGATTMHAIVMASAARRGDLVYTADVSDLMRLQGFFRAVRVLAA